MILAIDPGKICGWATLGEWGKPLENPEVRLCAGQEEIQPFLERMDDSLGCGDLVICEKFLITKRTMTATADAHWAMSAIGCLEYWCRRRGIPFVLQTPGEAKAFAADDKLKVLGWYRATKGGHRNDSMRHLLLYLVRNVRDEPGVREILKPLLV